VGGSPGGTITCASEHHDHMAAQPANTLINRDHIFACCSILARATPALVR
jgi:hypothetical protein